MQKQQIAALEAPWNSPSNATECKKSFTQDFKTVFKESQVQGYGWWALEDIPANTRLRRVSVDDGTLYRMGSEAELRASGWDMQDAVNYGIAHKADLGAIFFLNPGTACNHADPTRAASVRYDMTVKGVMEIWTTVDLKAGEEIFIDYGKDYVKCDWYDKLMKGQGQTPLCDLAAEINKMYAPSNHQTIETLLNRVKNLKGVRAKLISAKTKPIAPWKAHSNATECKKSFTQDFKTVFKESQVQGNGWWTLEDIPANTRLRRVAVDDGTLYRMGSEAELRASGWDMQDVVNYGIAHKADLGAIFFLNPGTACNHADPTRVASVRYDMTVKGVMEIWTTVDLKAGEEMFIDYGEDFVKCDWYDKLMKGQGQTPLCDLAAEIDKMYAPSDTPTMDARHQSFDASPSFDASRTVVGHCGA
jgi:predicted phosphodiesterase